MKALPYEWELLKKVLIGDPTQQNPNVAGGMCYIPGSVLRGALIGLLKKDTYIDQKDELYSVFFNGKTCFLNAYPGTYHFKRCIPSPSALRKKKEERESGIDIYNVLHEVPVDSQLVKFPGDFFWMNFEKASSEICYAHEPEMCVRMHNRRPPGAVNKTDEAQIFTYIALQAGQKMRGWIISEDPKSLNLIKRQFEDVESNMLYIGKSQGVEYGMVKLKMDEIIEDWQEVQAGAAVNNTITVTLLSDCILRDPVNGGFATNFDGLLGKEHKRAFAKMKMIGGYNRAWNMPLPQSMAIAAGSVFEYEDCDDIRKELTDLVQKGVGERTLDGFGRIALDLFSRDIYHLEESLDDEDVAILQDAITSLQDREARELKNIAARIYLERARKSIEEKVQKLDSEGMPSSSQLSRIVNVLRRQYALIQKKMDSESTPNMNECVQFLKELTKDTRSKFKRARIAESTFLEWLNDKISSPESIFTTLDVPWQSNVLGFDEGQRNRYAHLLTIEYLNTFVELILKSRKGEAS